MATSTGHLSPAESLPPLRMKTVNTVVWGTGGNTVTVTDTYCNTNSIPEWIVTGTTPQAGQWSFTMNNGSFKITSSQVENAALTFSYILL